MRTVGGRALLLILLAACKGKEAAPPPPPAAPPAPIKPLPQDSASAMRPMHMAPEAKAPPFTPPAKVVQGQKCGEPGMEGEPAPTRDSLIDAAGNPVALPSEASGMLDGCLADGARFLDLDPRGTGALYRVGPEGPFRWLDFARQRVSSVRLAGDHPEIYDLVWAPGGARAALVGQFERQWQVVVMDLVGGEARLQPVDSGGLRLGECGASCEVSGVTWKDDHTLELQELEGKQKKRIDVPLPAAPGPTAAFTPPAHRVDGVACRPDADLHTDHAFKVVDGKGAALPLPRELAAIFEHDCGNRELPPLLLDGGAFIAVQLGHTEAARVSYLDFARGASTSTPYVLGSLAPPVWDHLTRADDHHWVVTIKVRAKGGAAPAYMVFDPSAPAKTSLYAAQPQAAYDPGFGVLPLAQAPVKLVPLP